MADEGYDRDFPGNPNPVPRAPAAPTVAPAPAQEESGGTATATAAYDPGKPGPKAEVRINAVESVDGFELYMHTDEDPAVPMGRATSEATEILRASGAWYNEEAKSWEGIPEDVAASLPKGRLGFTDQMLARHRSGEAGLARMALGLKVSRGQMTPVDALERGRPDLLKAQFTERPDRVWEGIGDVLVHPWKALRNPKETLRSVGGSLAEQVPFLEGMLTAAVKGGSQGAAAGAAAGIAATVTTGGVALPAALAAVTGGASIGAAYEMWRYATEVGEGETAIQMAEKGATAETIRDLAPLAGVIKGTLDMASFSVMTAPVKRGFIKTVLNDPRVKTAMAKWYVTYATSVGAEVTTEMAQTRVDQVALNFAAQIDANPDLALKPDEAANELWNTAVEAFNVSLVLGGAGAALDAGAARAEGRADAKAQAETAKAKAAQAKKIEAALVPLTPAQAEGVQQTLQNPMPAQEQAAAAGATPSVVQPGKPGSQPPVAVQDPAGDYLPRAEKATAQIDDVIAKLNEDPTTAPDAADAVESALKEMDARPQNYGEKVIDAERKALLETRRRELEANQAQISALQKEQARYERNDMGTKVILGRIDALLEENARLRGDIEFYDKAVPQQVGIEAADDLTMKPATLENLLEMGFKEGRKEVLGARRKAVIDVAKRLDLTQADLRGILKDKNYGTMGDEQFSNWMETKFKPEAKAAAKRRIMQTQVRRVQVEKSLQREGLVRQQAGLPAVKDMTLDQMQEYIDLLETFDRGDRPLTPRRKQALETTKLAGAKSWGEVLARARELGSVPLDDAQMLLPERTIIPDTVRGLERLATRSPVHKVLVQVLRTEIIAEETVRQAKHEKLMELGARALASRKGFFGRIINPTMPEVMAHLEADDGKVYIGETNLPVLTPEEAALVEFIESIYLDGLTYLQTTEGMKTRFENKYYTHIKRDALEIINDIGDAGLRATLKELYASAEPTVINFSEAAGNQVGLRKHIKQMQFRTGEMKPSKNVLRSVDQYLHAVHRKKALDRAVPFIDSTVDAVTWGNKDKSAEGKARKVALDKFFDFYLKSAKGQAVIEHVGHGSFLDLASRAATALPSWAWIAANPELQVAAKFGELAAANQVIGPVGIADAWRLRALAAMPEKVRGEYGAAVAKYLIDNEGFTGKPIVDLDAFLHGEFRGRWTDPSVTLDERTGMLLFGMFQQHRVDTMRDILLALSTKEEILSGKISPERLAEIEALAARWVDTKGSKSVLGGTSLGMIITQFKGWAIPIIGSTLEDHQALGKQLAGKGKMTELQKLELRRLYTTWATLAVVAMWVGDKLEDEQDKSFSMSFLRAIYREIFTTAGGANPILFFAFPTASYIFRLGQALELTAHGLIDRATKRENQKGTYQSGPREGELKGPRALMKLVPGATGIRKAKQLIYGPEEEN